MLLNIFISSQRRGIYRLSLRILCDKIQLWKISIFVRMSAGPADVKCSDCLPSFMEYSLQNTMSVYKYEDKRLGGKVTIFSSPGFFYMRVQGPLLRRC